MKLSNCPKKCYTQVGHIVMLILVKKVNESLPLSYHGTTNDTKRVLQTHAINRNQCTAVLLHPSHFVNISRIYTYQSSLCATYFTHPVM